MYTDWTIEKNTPKYGKAKITLLKDRSAFKDFMLLCYLKGHPVPLLTQVVLLVTYDTQSYYSSTTKR